jgi:putative RNA 2'-phosphotransferase
VLWHGTGLKFLESIRKQGLLPGDRHDVHLSTTKETALAVGSRKGRAVLLMIETYPLVRDGYKFRCSENGVWLTHGIPSNYIKFPD